MEEEKIDPGMEMLKRKRRARKWELWGTIMCAIGFVMALTGSAFGGLLFIIGLVVFIRGRFLD